MPQFCILFYAIIQSWRPKGGGGHGTMPPHKYAPEHGVNFTVSARYTSNLYGIDAVAYAGFSKGGDQEI